MPITDPIFLTTFQGSTITRDGVTYVWVNGKYEVSTSIPQPTQDALLITKTLFLKFYGIVNPDINLTGADLQVFVDGQEWIGNYRIENQNSVQIKLDEPFITTQRLITFKSTKGNPKYRYAVKSRVFTQNDVVIAKVGIAEEVPILGTSETATTTYTTPINPGLPPNTAIEYKSTTVPLGDAAYTINNDIVNSTIREVTGPSIL